MSFHAPIQPAAAKMAFSSWLLTQHHRTDAIGQLAAAARRDAGFPADGDFRRISQRLNELGADAEMHEALEDAELDWAAH